MAVTLVLTMTVSITQAQNLILDLNAGIPASFTTGSGNTWTDISGSGNDAIGVGYDPSAETGWTGTSFTSGFGSGKYFSIPFFSGATNSAGSIEAWFDIDGGSPGGTPQNLFSMDAEGESRFTINDNRFEWRHKNCGGNSCIKDGSVATFNTTQQVVLTSDGSTLSVYVDGAFVTSNGNGAAWLDSTGGTGAFVQQGSGQTGINGDLYIIRYYDAALSEDDVAFNFAAGLEGSNYLGADSAGPRPTNTDFGWKSDISGDWNDAANWLPNKGLPGDQNGDSPANHTATFGGSITTNQTVYTNTSVSVRHIGFDNSNTYAVTGTGSVSLIQGTAPESVTSIETLLGNHEFQAPVNLLASTTVNVASDSGLTFNNALNLNGNTLTKTGPGTMVVNNRLNNGGGTIDIVEGTVSGIGTIGGNVDNSGVIAPGNSPGVLTVDGNLNNSAAGTIAIEIDGTDGPGQAQGHDQIQVTGSSTLDGTLSITTGTYADPTTRAARDSFALIVSAGGSTGNFGTVSYNGTDLSADFNGDNGSFRDHIDNGLFRNVNYDGNNVSVTNLFALEGDADCDIDIDITDFNILASNFDDTGANSETNSWTTADFDADGDIDITDFNFLATNFADTGYAEPASGQVPEPASWILAVMTILAAAGLSGRWR